MMTSAALQLRGNTWLRIHCIVHRLSALDVSVVAALGAVSPAFLEDRRVGDSQLLVFDRWKQCALSFV